MKKSDVAELKNSLQTSYNQGYKLLISKKYEDISTSLSYFLDALATSEKAYDNQNNPNTASVLHCIGLAYQKLQGVDNCLKALDFHNRALEMRQACYGNVANVEIANSLRALGDTYRALDDKVNISKGLEFANKALEMRQELYQGQIHPKIIESLFTIGTIHSSLESDENLAKSSYLLEQALSMAKSLYGERSHLIIASILNSLGVNYEKLGGTDNLNKALVYLEESLDTHRMLTSSIDSEAAANAINNIGTLHYKLSLIDVENKQKHLEQHLQHAQKAMHVNQVLYGDHPSRALARSMQDLSLAYINKGEAFDLKQAYRLQKQALKVYQKLYAADHPDVIGCLNNLNYIIRKHSLRSDDDITSEETQSSDAQWSNVQMKDNEHSLSQSLDKDSTNFIGSIDLDKDTM